VAASSSRQEYTRNHPHYRLLSDKMDPEFERMMAQAQAARGAGQPGTEVAMPDNGEVIHISSLALLKNAKAWTRGSSYGGHGSHAGGICGRLYGSGH